MLKSLNWYFFSFRWCETCIHSSHSCMASHYCGGTWCGCAVKRVMGKSCHTTDICSGLLFQGEKYTAVLKWMVLIWYNNTAWLFAVNKIPSLTYTKVYHMALWLETNIIRPIFTSFKSENVYSGKQRATTQARAQLDPVDILYSI